MTKPTKKGHKPITAEEVAAHILGYWPPHEYSDAGRQIASFAKQESQLLVEASEKALRRLETGSGIDEAQDFMLRQDAKRLREVINAHKEKYGEKS